MDDSRSCKRFLKKSASYKYTINKTGDVDLLWKVFNTPFESYCINYRWWECLSSSKYYDIISSGVILNPEFLRECIGLSKICQGRQISRDVTVCIVDTGTQNKLLFQLCMRLCLHVFSSLGTSQTFNSSQCFSTNSPLYHILWSMNLAIC